MTSEETNDSNTRSPWAPLFACLWLVTCITSAAAVAAERENTRHCHIVIGPTSETNLNQANMEWANLLASRLLEQDLDCKVEAFDA